MQLQKAMIAAIKELSYTINTMGISSLATNDEERERVRERITKMNRDQEIASTAKAVKFGSNGSGVEFVTRS